MSQVAIELTLSLLCSVVAFIMKHKCRKNILIWICYNNFKMCRSELCIRFWNVSWLLYHRFNYEIINNIVYCTLLWYFKISVINSRSNLLGQVLHKWREFKYFLELFMYLKLAWLEDDDKVKNMFSFLIIQKFATFCQILSTVPPITN